MTDPRDEADLAALLWNLGVPLGYVDEFWTVVNHCMVTDGDPLEVALFKGVSAAKRLAADQVARDRGSKL